MVEEAVDGAHASGLLGPQLLACLVRRFICLGYLGEDSIQFVGLRTTLWVEGADVRHRARAMNSVLGEVLLCKVSWVFVIHDALS